MAKSGSIISNPKSKQSTQSWPKKDSVRNQKVSKTSGQFRSVSKERGKGYIELPPGPDNFIVRTPYPVAPSKEDKKS